MILLVVAIGKSIHPVVPTSNMPLETMKEVCSVFILAESHQQYTCTALELALIQDKRLVAEFLTH